MTFFLQAFFLFFYEKGEKCRVIHNQKSLSRHDFRLRQPVSGKMPFFAQFQGFNIFNKWIVPLYQHLTNIYEPNRTRVSLLLRHYCNIYFTIDFFYIRFTFAFSPCDREHKKNTINELAIFLQGIRYQLKYLCLRCN